MSPPRGERPWSIEAEIEAEIEYYESTLSTMLNFTEESE